jgi:hypothetical protein
MRYGVHIQGEYTFSGRPNVPGGRLAPGAPICARRTSRVRICSVQSARATRLTSSPCLTQRRRALPWLLGFAPEPRIRTTLEPGPRAKGRALALTRRRRRLHREARAPPAGKGWRSLASGWQWRRAGALRRRPVERPHPRARAVEEPAGGRARAPAAGGCRRQAHRAAATCLRENHRAARHRPDRLRVPSREPPVEAVRRQMPGRSRTAALPDRGLAAWGVPDWAAAFRGAGQCRAVRRAEEPRCPAR